MKLEEFFNRQVVLDLSFFNFRNAITAAYFANDQLEILQVNKNFTRFFPVLGNVKSAYFPDVLLQLGVPSDQVDAFTSEIDKKGSVLIPDIRISIDGEERVYSLLSAKTQDDGFTYLNGIQGQFVDRTNEWNLKKERELLLDQKLKQQEIIEEKSNRLENLASRLAQYLSPQVYQSIFDEESNERRSYSRKNLTVFFSDIVQFTDLSDTMEPERLATIVNSYLSEMASIALECGGTIDKFIGDAILVFFGDPETRGEVADAINCCEMAIRMQNRVQELQQHWQKLGAAKGMHVRMGITSGFCTVGDFGSEQRLDYTILGSPVNLAARLQGIAPPDAIYIDDNTYNLIESTVDSVPVEQITPKGFARPVQVYQLGDFISEKHHKTRQQLTRVGKRVEVSVTDSSNIRAAIKELKAIQMDFENQLAKRDE